jgi:hypothetical protein
MKLQIISNAKKWAKQNNDSLDSSRMNSKGQLPGANRNGRLEPARRKP